MDQYNITPELVRHVAKLAALDLDELEEKRFVEDLNRILGYMKELSSLNTGGIEASFQTIPISNVMRPDQTSIPLLPSHVLQNAPLQEEGFFKMPPILE